MSDSTGGVRLSVVIVNFNTEGLLKACLTSMRSYLDDQRYEVIVVDNASRDGSLAMIQRDFPQVLVFPQSENLGFAKANNIGLRAARGQYLLALNSDTEVVRDALGVMCRYMDDHADIGALGPQLLNTDLTVQLSCRRFPSYRTALFHRYSILTRLFPRNKYSKEYLMTDTGHRNTMEVDWVSGACLLTRRETVEQVGLLDEGFFMYAEDVDWCYRIKAAGWKVVYFPDAQIVHHIGRSTRKVPFRMSYERHRSMWRFYRKHYSKDVLLIDVATWLGIALRFTVIAAKHFLQSLFGGEKSA